MIWLLLLLLAMATYINYEISVADIFHPAVIASAIFTIFCFCCCLANFYIGIDIENIATIVVIMLGIGIFTLCNIFTHKSKYIFDNLYKKNITTPAIFGIIGTICTSVAIYVNYHYIIDFAAAYGINGSFFEAAVQYKLIMTFHDFDDILIPSPWYRNFLLSTSSCFAYFAVYIFIRKKVIDGKSSLVYGTNIFLYILLSLMEGGRTGTFRIITAAMFLWYVFYKTKKGKLFHVKSVLAKLVVIMLMIILFFISYLNISGRNEGSMNFELVITEIFVYTGAPIFNLDIYLGNPWQQTHGIFGELTFSVFINWLGRKFDDSSLIYEMDLPFLSYQNYGLGNVYTTFYAFIYDFGFIGVIVLTTIMAVIYVWLYNKVKVSRIMENNISFVVICYAYLVNDVVMLPFSNRFYESVVNIPMLYIFIILYLLVSIANIVNKNIKHNECKKIQ